MVSGVSFSLEKPACSFVAHIFDSYLKFYETIFGTSEDKKGARL